MQTFLISPSFQETAQVLDNRRLGKQRVECLQILKTLAIGPTYVEILNPFGNFKETYKYHECGGEREMKTPWYNHPATQMWKGYSEMLAFYGAIMCEEWINRGFKDTCKEKILKYLPNIEELMSCYSSPKWLSDRRIFVSHRSNLLRKNKEYYSAWGWEEPDNLPYFWPTKNGY